MWLPRAGQQLTSDERHRHNTCEKSFIHSRTILAVRTFVNSLAQV